MKPFTCGILLLSVVLSSSNFAMTKKYHPVKTGGLLGSTTGLLNNNGLNDLTGNSPLSGLDLDDTVDVLPVKHVVSTAFKSPAGDILNNEAVSDFYNNLGNTVSNPTDSLNVNGVRKIGHTIVHHPVVNSAYNNDLTSPYVSQLSSATDLINGDDTLKSVVASLPIQKQLELKKLLGNLDYNTDSVVKVHPNENYPTGGQLSHGQRLSCTVVNE